MFTGGLSALKGVCLSLNGHDAERVTVCEVWPRAERAFWF